MKPYRAAVAAFVISGIVLFGLSLFLIGDRHTAFSHHVNFYTELGNVNGLAPGAHVRVSGYDSGQVTEIAIPSQPSGRFRLKLHIDDKLRNLIRADSVVTVETDGLVGDKFLLIHPGTESAATITDGATLPGKEPIELSAVIAKVSGTVDQAGATIADVRTTLGDVRTRLDGTFDSITTTVNNANSIVTSVRSGNGSVGALLNDRQMAADVKAIATNTRSATDHLDQVSVQATQITADFQSRNLFQKADETLDNARHASEQLNQASEQVNNSLKDALGPNSSGHYAGDDIRETLSNLDITTANLADDTEALKHQFLFRGFFKKRGFYSLQDLDPDQYRENNYFQIHGRARSWLKADEAFTSGSNGHELLTSLGKQQVDAFVGSEGGSELNAPIVVEGYSNVSLSAEQLLISHARALLVKAYLQKRFGIDSKYIGVIALRATAPPSSGKATWDGVSILLLNKNH